MNNFQCPICITTTTAPNMVLQCENGHLLCHQCLLKIRDLCPQCRVPFGEIVRLVVDLNRVIVSCSSKKSGCVQTMKRNDVQAHNKICAFRAVNICSNLGFNGCKTSFRSSVKLIKHLKEAHCVIPNNVRNLIRTQISLKNEECSSNQEKTLIKCIVATVNRRLEPFLIVVKIGPVFEGNSFHRCAVIYVGDGDSNPISVCKAEDFKAKIDIDIKQEQKETHISSSTGFPLDYKKAEDANVIPYLHTSVNYIKSRLDPGTETGFEIIATVEISYRSTIKNGTDSGVSLKRPCDTRMATADLLRHKLRVKFDQFELLKAMEDTDT